MIFFPCIFWGGNKQESNRQLLRLEHPIKKKTN
ncbi:MAG: hypothetical protein MRECE_16c031 [Mycoplasmataceae bacterium CE_OT135]|nr:MAG: hypothetical protein MRECE_16c031 [Mycoplasmataceae bacterium CE_OT135]